MRPPTLQDVDLMVESIRPADLLEMQAGSDLDLRSVLCRSLARSPHRWVAEVNGEMGLMGGVCARSLLGGVGCPWMIATARMEEFPGALTRVGKRYRDVALGLYPHLINFVDVRNHGAIEWLKRLKFSVDDAPTPYGPYGMPFYKFELRRSPLV